MIKLKRIVYASVFFVAVLFVMQSKGMLEQLRYWWQHGFGSGDEAAYEILKEDPYERREDVEENWQLLKETPQEIYEAQEYIEKIKWIISSMGPSIKEIRARGLSDEEKKILIDAKNNIRSNLEKLKPVQEETNNLLARTSSNYVREAQKNIESNFAGINLKPEDAYSYLYQDKAKQAVGYSYKDIYQYIENKLASPDISEEDKNILRQLGYIFRTAPGKEQFDAYLNSTLAQMVITDKQEEERVLALYREIESAKMGLSELEDKIKQLLQ